MPEHHIDPEDFDLHTQLVGHICISWASMEHYIEYALWWLMDVTPEEGRAITGPMDIRQRIRKLGELATEDRLPPDEVEFFAKIIEKVTKDAVERNLAVHGLRLTKAGEPEFYVVTGRGKFKDQPQHLTFGRMSRLIIRVDVTAKIIEDFLAKKGVLQADEHAP